jgi:hypothetical protein
VFTQAFIERFNTQHIRMRFEMSTSRLVERRSPPYFIRIFDLLLVRSAQLTSVRDLFEGAPLTDKPARDVAQKSKKITLKPGPYG